MKPGPSIDCGPDHASETKARIGLKLFFVYLVVYFGFVFINTFSPRLMETKVFLGVNLACAYGIGLIILAIVMGIAYNHICTGWENKMNRVCSAEEKQSEKQESGNIEKACAGGDE